MTTFKKRPWWQWLAFIGVVLAVVTAGTISILDQLQRPMVTQQESESLSLTSTIITMNGHAIVAELALDDASRTQGLSFRESLSPGRGMLFLFDDVQPLRFWMYGMHFPIDMIFLRNEEVVYVEHNVPPPNGGIPAIVSSPEEGDMVLELNAGEAMQYQIEKGTKLHWFGR